MEVPLLTLGATVPRPVSEAVIPLSEPPTIHPEADGLICLDLVVQSKVRSGGPSAPPAAVYCPLAAVEMCAGAAKDRAIVAQLVPAAEIH